MTTLFRAATFAALGLAAVVLAAGAGARAEDKKDEKLPSIKTIMVQGHKGSDAFLGKIGAEVKGEKWEDATTHAKAMAVFGEALGKNKPKKGDAESWEKLSKAYNENTKALLKATEAKDADAAGKALKALGGSCKECHTAHK